MSLTMNDLCLMYYQLKTSSSACIAFCIWHINFWWIMAIIKLWNYAISSNYSSFQEWPSPSVRVFMVILFYNLIENFYLNLYIWPLTNISVLTFWVVITGGLDSKLVMWDFSKGRRLKIVDFGKCISLLQSLLNCKISFCAFNNFNATLVKVTVIPSVFI